MKLPTKLPTEAELSEMENAILPDWRYRLANQKFDDFGKNWRILHTLETLIALARDPSQLLRDIPDDAALDRELQSPRTADPEPVSSLQPKQF